MGEPLICFRCGKDTLKWDKESLAADEREEIDLLEGGRMYCPSCKAEWVGMKGYVKETMPKLFKGYYEMGEGI